MASRPDIASIDGTKGDADLSFGERPQVSRLFLSAILTPFDSIIRKVADEFDANRADIVNLKTELPKNIFCVLSPHLIAKIFTTPDISIFKPPGLMPREDWLMREAIIADTGKGWKRKRAVMSPPFMPQNHGGFFESVAPAAHRLEERLDALARRNEAANICWEARRCITDFSLRMLFSTVAGDDRLDALVRTIVDIESVLPSQVPLALPLPGNFAFRRNCRELRAFCAELIAARRSSRAGPGDFLDYLLSAEDEALGRKWHDDEILDQILAVFLGASAIATPLFWTAYLLSVHPGACREVRDEFERVCVGGGVATYEESKSLERLEWVMQESLRLYPPFWGNIRYAKDATEIEGHRFPKNTVFLMLRYFANRHPGFWPNPQAFDPARFDPANPSRIKPRYMIPFGSGPRTCLGVHMAVPVCKMILSYVFSRYEFAYPVTVPNGQPKVSFRYGLYPRQDIRLRVAGRS